MPSSIPKAVTRKSAKEDKFCNICGKQIYKIEEKVAHLGWIVVFDNRNVCDNTMCMTAWNKKAKGGEEDMAGFINVY